MTWSEKRIVTVLSAILAILTAALLIVLSIRYREHRQQVQDGAFVTEDGTVVPSDSYTGLRYSNGTASLTFSMDPSGKWVWADEPDFPLDDAHLLAIFDCLDSMEPQQTLSVEADLHEYGLDHPRAGVTATLADGSTRTVDVGKSTTDGQSFYASVNGDETTVSIFPNQLYDLLQLPIYDMMKLPQLPQLPQHRLKWVRIQGHLGENASAPMVTLTARQEGGEAPKTHWLAGGEDVTKNKLVQDLMEDLSDLTLNRCVDYAPSEGALTICGMDDPAAVLTVAYTAENGTDQELQISIGTRLRDGSGRYIQWNGDSNIYFLTTELLDPLMHISANGLEA